MIITIDNNWTFVHYQYLKVTYLSTRSKLRATASGRLHAIIRIGKTTVSGSTLSYWSLLSLACWLTTWLACSFCFCSEICWKLGNDCMLIKILTEQWETYQTLLQKLLKATHNILVSIFSYCYKLQLTKKKCISNKNKHRTLYRSTTDCCRIKYCTGWWQYEQCSKYFLLQIK